MDDTGLLVRTELLRQQQDARGTVNRGVLLIALVPIVLVGGIIGALALHGLPGFISVLVAASYTIVGGIAGIATIVGGLTDHRRWTRQLRELDELRQLPAARVVQR